jgi:hypothetical protein
MKQAQTTTQTQTTITVSLTIETNVQPTNLFQKLFLSLRRHTLQNVETFTVTNITDVQINTLKSRLNKLTQLTKTTNNN